MPSRSMMFSVMLPLRATLRFDLAPLVGEGCGEPREPRVDWDVGLDVEERGGGRDLLVGVASLELRFVLLGDSLCSKSGAERSPLLGV